VSPLFWIACAGWLTLCRLRRATADADADDSGDPARGLDVSAAGRTVKPARLPLLAGLCVATAATLFGGLAGIIAAVPLGAVVGWLLTRLSTTHSDEALDLRSAALLLDLVASALSSGSPPAVAIARVSGAARAAGGAELRRAAEPLQRVGRLLQLGTDPGAAWSGLEATSEYRGAAMAARRCANSGARLAGALTSAAAELRAQRHSNALARAERVGVWVLLPLGLCFLPAFVCVGVVPVIIGVAGQALSGVAQ